MRNWLQAVILLVVGVICAVALLSVGSPITAVLLLAWCLAFAAMASPLVFPSSSSAAEAQARSAADGQPIIYWRPGCPYCLRLRFTLGAAASGAHWVNIWADDESGAAVRAVAEGNETVPTAVIAGEAHVNPAPAVVRAWLRP
jgi:mycoredoxin